MKDFKEKETIRFFLHQNSINLFFSVKEDFSLPADVSSLQVIVLERLTWFCENIRLDLIMNIKSSVGNDSHHDHLDSHVFESGIPLCHCLIFTMVSLISLLTSQRLLIISNQAGLEFDPRDQTIKVALYKCRLKVLNF